MHTPYSLYKLVHIYIASIFYYLIVYVISFIRPTCGTQIPTGQLVGFTHQALTNQESRFSTLNFSHQALTNHTSCFSSLDFTQIWPSVPDQSQDMAQFGKIKKNSASSPNQSQITVQLTGQLVVQIPHFGLTKISPDFTIKGGLLTPFQHHPTRENLPSTTISLTTHPSHSTELTTTLIKLSSGVFLNQVFQQSLSYLVLAKGNFKHTRNLS